MGSIVPFQALIETASYNEFHVMYMESCSSDLTVLGQGAERLWPILWIMEWNKLSERIVKGVEGTFMVDSCDKIPWDSKLFQQATTKCRYCLENV